MPPIGYNIAMHEYIRQKDLVMTREQVRSFDAWAINTAKIPGTVLMENAGRSCAELVAHRLANIKNAKVCIFCGTGNNGGDGFVIARHLANKSISVRVVICGAPAKIKGDAEINFKIIKKLNMDMIQLNHEKSDISSLCDDCDMLVDAIFGTGLKGALRDEYIRLIKAINAQSAPIIAVDIPSGLDCNTGKPLGAAIVAQATVTFVAAKTGFTLPEAQKYTSKVFVASIGIEPSNPAFDKITRQKNRGDS